MYARGKKCNFLLSFLLLTLSSFLPSFSLPCSFPSIFLLFLPFFLPPHTLAVYSSLLLLSFLYLYVFSSSFSFFFFLLPNLINPLVKCPLIMYSFTLHFVPFLLILSCSPLRNLLSYPHVHPGNICRFLSFPLVVT